MEPETESSSSALVPERFSVIGGGSTSNDPQSSSNVADLKSLTVQIGGLGTQLETAETKIKELEKVEPKINKRFEKYEEKSQQSTAQNLEILSIFVALFTFVSIQFQAFSNANKTLLTSLSLITGGVLVLIVCLLSLLISSWRKNETSRNLFRGSILLTALLAIIFGYVSYNKVLGQQDICSDIQREAGQALLAKQTDEVNQLSDKYNVLCR